MIATATASVLVTDGDERSALASVRSLVASGYRVHVASRESPCLAGASRQVHGVTVRADALTHPRNYADEIAHIVRDRGVRLLIPVTDQSVEALLEHRDLLPDTVNFPFPELSTYRIAADKAAMLDRAEQAGLAVPPSILLESRDDMERAALASMFPAVLKPRTSVVLLADGTRRKLAVSFVQDVHEYRRTVANLPAYAFPLLVQQRVRGRGEGMFLLRWGGEIIAQFAHRRLREKPPAGGVSVYRESIAVPADLAAASRRLLDALDWRGVAMVECKRDEQTGRHVFMEVNGRLWGSLQLALDAGVDFPALLAQCAAGEHPDAVLDYRVGIRSRWFWGDVDHLYLRLRRSRARLHLDANAPGRLAAVRDFCTFWRSDDSEEIWRWRDPKPFLLETARRFSF